MLVYNYKHANAQKQICVELVDTIFVAKWKRYLKKTAHNLPDLLWSMKWLPLTKLNQANDTRLFAAIKANLTKIRSAFDFIGQNLDLNFSKEISDINHLLDNPGETSQQHLNHWHRHFTATIIHTCQSDALHNVPADLHSKLIAFIHDINHYVHLLENIIYSESRNRLELKYSNQWTIGCCDTYNIGPNPLWAENQNEAITDVFCPLTDEYDHNTDVWIHADILGKEHIKAWLDDDVLTESDVHGCLYMTPNITLDPDLIYSTILNNPNFIAEYKNSGKPLNRWPLGKLKTTVDWNSVTNSNRITIDSITLDDEILWTNQ